MVSLEVYLNIISKLPLYYEEKNVKVRIEQEKSRKLINFVKKKIATGVRKRYFVNIVNESGVKMNIF